LFENEEAGRRVVASHDPFLMEAPERLLQGNAGFVFAEDAQAD
jgi:hypothetical protein